MFLNLICQTEFLPLITRNTSILEAITPCFAFSIAPLAPMTFSILTFIFLLAYSRIFSDQSLTFSSRVKVKLGIFGCLFACLLLSSLLNIFVGLQNGHLLEQYVFASSSIVFITLFCASYAICLRHGIASSGFLHLSSLFWFILTLPLWLWMFRQVFHFENYDKILILMFIVYSLNSIISLSSIIALCFADVDSVQNYQRLDGKPPCPFSHSSFLQNILYSYSGSLLRKSFSNPLTINDDYWQLEERARASNIANNVDLPKNASLFNLLFILCKVCWPQLLVAIMSACGNVSMRLGYCLFLKLSLETATGDYPFWLVALCVTLIIVCDLIRNIIFSQSCLAGYQTYLNIRTALISMVFNKMMRLSPSTQTSTSVGVITNHISVDIQHNKNFWYELQFILYCPLMISTCIYFLSREVGFRNTYIGCIVLLTFMIFNIFMSRVYKKFEIAQMKYKDDRLRIVTDVLNGIKLVKFYGWEESMQKLISKMRRKELKWLRNAYFVDNIIGCTFNLGPLLATISTFYGYVILDKNRLTADVAFLTLVFFAVTRFAIYKLPLLFTNAIMAFVSLRRLLDFFNKQDRPLSHVMERGDSHIVASFSNANFSWSDSIDNLTLQNINLQIQKGQLIAILGRVGSGKSTLLQALAGELNCIQGECLIRSNSIAYLPQLPWIQNKTLRDNVIFDVEEADSNFYNQVLTACSLNEDLNLLHSRDLTEIGERGINLSGGQKSRVGLARAVFRQAEFYVVDDPFSALDQNVGAQIFQNVFGPNGLLNEKTRIIALNSTNFLPFFDSIIYLEDGQIKHFGNYDSIGHIFNTPLIETNFQSRPEILPEKESQKIVESPDLLIEAEELRTDRRSVFLFFKYIQSFGVPLFILYIFLLGVCSTVLIAIANLYIAHWVSESESGEQQSFGKLRTYAMFSVSSTLFVVTAYLLQTYGSFRAAQSIHDSVVHRVLRAPMAFFDRTPIGRILNRLSSDIERVDTGISHFYGFLFILVAEVIQCLLGIFIAIPYLLIVISPLIVTFIFSVRFFNKASIQFRRITSNSISTVISSVSDAFTGASSIRVFGCLEKFKSDFYSKLDLTTESQLVEVLTSYFMQIRLDLLTDIIVLIFLLIAALFNSLELISIGLFAMVINNCILLCGFFGEVADIYRSAETELIAVERLDEYTKLDEEPIWQHLSNKPNVLPNSWSVEFENVSLRYRENDDPVLHNISFRVESGERIGIIGRTGAGKTSLTSLLFRLVEPFGGRIYIGGVDIKELGHNLRRILTIIPQDPILFSGSLRSNLDPFNEFEDREILEALERAHMSRFFVDISTCLDTIVNDGGTNFSVGQRQLICITRALLRQTKLLILDEASASIDLETDALIQQTIRQQFANSTILTIAHRIDTISDYDRVLEMESGHVKAFDKPEVMFNQ